MTAQQIFQFADGGSIPTSPHQFLIKNIPELSAMKFNEMTHSILPRISLTGYNDYKVCYGFIYGGNLYATAIWTRPIARNLNGRGWLELRRYAISDDAPKNTASWGLSRMAKLIKKEHPEVVKLISYQDTDVHSGTIYKASNWTPIKTNSKISTGWNSRKRNKMQATGEKVRWEWTYNGSPTLPDGNPTDSLTGGYQASLEAQTPNGASDNRTDVNRNKGECL